MHIQVIGRTCRVIAHFCRVHKCDFCAAAEAPAPQLFADLVTNSVRFADDVLIVLELATLYGTRSILRTMPARLLVPVFAPATHIVCCRFAALPLFRSLWLRRGAAYVRVFAAVSHFNSISSSSMP